MTEGQKEQFGNPHPGFTIRPSSPDRAQTGETSPETAPPTHEQVLNALQGRVLVPPVPRKDQAGFRPAPLLLRRLDSVQPLHARDPELDHVQEVLVVRASDDQVLRPLLTVRSKAEKGAIVLVGQELQGDYVLKGTNFILSAQKLCVGLQEFGLQRKEGGEGVKGWSRGREICVRSRECLDFQPCYKHQCWHGIRTKSRSTVCKS